MGMNDKVMANAARKKHGRLVPMCDDPGGDIGGDVDSGAVIEVSGHAPDPSKHYVVGFSGGKDSVATWLYLTRELNLPNVTCVFADVGHEFQETHDYLDLLEREHGLPLVKIHPTLEDMKGELKDEKLCERLGIDPASDPEWRGRQLTMEMLAILKRRFPSRSVRFCTSILKLSPRKRWLAENCELEKTISVSGVRAQESPARARRPEFSWDELMGCQLWLPIHKWTHSEVFDLHKKHGVPPNPLYLQGMGRVGCAPCIMATKCELGAIALNKPETFDSLREMERRVAAAVGKDEMSWFSHGKTPNRYASHTSEGTGKRFPDAMDVKAWAEGSVPVNSGQIQLPMFEEDWTEDAYQCTSQYGLCE